MATISNTPRPGYVWDSTDNVWYPIGVGAHSHTLTAGDVSGVVAQTNYSPAGKNIWHNGGMDIWQRGSTTVTSNSNGAVRLPDRYYFARSGTANYTMGQSTDVPAASGLSYSTIITCTSTSTPASTDIDGFNQVMEMQNIAPFNNQPFAWSFWVKSSLPGTYNASLTNAVGDPNRREFVGVYTINSANTWERKTILIPALDWNKSGYALNGYGLVFGFTMSAGTSRDATPGVWHIGGGEKVTSAGHTNLCSTLNATWQVTGIQLEIGTSITPFVRAGGNIQNELAACQRYYWRSTPQTTFGMYGLGVAGSTTQALVSLKLPVTMRAIPTSIDVPTTITSLKLTNYTATNWTISAVALLDSTFDNLLLSVTSSGMTANQALILGNNNNAAGFIGASAEL